MLTKKSSKIPAPEVDAITYTEIEYVPRNACRKPTVNHHVDGVELRGSHKSPIVHVTYMTFYKIFIDLVMPFMVMMTKHVMFDVLPKPAVTAAIELGGNQYTFSIGQLIRILGNIKKHAPRNKIFPPEFDTICDYLYRIQLFYKNPKRICTNYECSGRIKMIAQTTQECTACQTQLCSLCHGDHHISVTCEDARTSDYATQRAIEKGEIVLCPGCKTTTSRIDGCNHMKCTDCGTHYCWTCSIELHPQDPYSHYHTSDCNTFGGKGSDGYN